MLTDRRRHWNRDRRPWCRRAVRSRNPRLLPTGCRLPVADRSGRGDAHISRRWKPAGGRLLTATRPRRCFRASTSMAASEWARRTCSLALARAPGPKYFGTFIEYTALIGALGYQQAVQLLRGATLIAIDEFELDDPGDTMMMTRLLGELVDSGSRIAATSNTPPNALGEGRFAASDFRREIQALSDRFDTVRIDGLDYRRRPFEGHAVALSDDVRPSRLALADLPRHEYRPMTSPPCFSTSRRFIRPVMSSSSTDCRRSRAATMCQPDRPDRRAAPRRLRRPLVRRPGAHRRERYPARRGVRR